MGAYHLRPAMPSALPVCGRSISGLSTPGSPTCRAWTCAACCGTRSAPRSTSSPIVTRPTKRRAARLCGAALFVCKPPIAQWLAAPANRRTARDASRLHLGRGAFY